MMKKENKVRIILSLILIVLWISFPLMAENEKGSFLQRKVNDLSKNKASLTEKFALAQSDFQKTKGGNFYFTVYTFLSRHKIHEDSCWSGKDHAVAVKAEKIKISSKGKGWNTVETTGDKDKEGAQTGLLLLHNLFQKSDEFADARLIDIDETYEFFETPVYWLGEVNTEESFLFLEKNFESQDTHLREDLVFIISSHSSPETYNFLKKAALGTYTNKVRKTAIFWLGNYKDEKSLNCLKEIYAKEQDTKIKEHIVFALQLSSQKQALEELIRIARTDSNREVRKNAVFWIGQKASAECIKALKEIVQEPKEESDIKEHAVFAISQLPKEKSVPLLVDIARTNKSAAVRKKAIFWLGQTGSDEALKFFEEILLKK